MSTTEIAEYVAVAREAALRAAVVLEDWRKRFSVREKGRADLVTDADLASQKTIHGYLCGRFPDHQFLGEEDLASLDAASRERKRPEDAAKDKRPTWIVDPIDGTTNYVHDCPMYCVSIGLQVAGQLVAGVVYDPRQKEMFSAGQGMGAWLNDERIQVSACDKLDDALLATGFPPDLRGQERALDWWRYFSLRTRSLRRTGSTALNLAYVAAGRFDGYWAFDNHVWDVAGGTVLVREAGGVISDVDGAAYDPYTPDALAGNARLHPIMLKALAEGP